MPFINDLPIVSIALLSSQGLVLNSGDDPITIRQTNSKTVLGKNNGKNLIFVFLIPIIFQYIILIKVT
ncbi:hypothetical protein C0V80_04000 [Leuconostoc pseudomesenteroides]|nr:hypothetical protein [Leuconostoc pseudomesenteroides]